MRRDVRSRAEAVEVLFVIAAAIEFAAVDPDKMSAEVEVIEELAGKNGGLRSGDEKSASGDVEVVEHFDDAGIDVVLEQSDGGVALTIVAQGEFDLGGVIGAEQRPETLAQRRPMALLNSSSA